ncbi:MAG: glycosyltransferase family 4 protein, partial [Thermoanaerobaculia bacterium]
PGSSRAPRNQLLREIVLMGSICIVGVDGNKVVKDFIRAHVEFLSGPKVCLDHWYPDHKHDDKTIRYFYSRNPTARRIEKLLPHAVYTRVSTTPGRTLSAIDDSYTTFFKQHNVDVILAEFGPNGADITPIARKLGIPLIVHFHGHDAHRLSVVNAYRDRYKEMFDYAFRIISVSRYMTHALIELGADPHRITYNPYGPRDDFFGVSPDYRKNVLSVGRFTDIKANHLSLLAFRRALDTVPDAHLTMVGSGELLEACKSLAHAVGISKHVTFAGAVHHSEVLSYYAKACCFAQHSVSPSYGDAEGTPVAILEAGAAALPVVATRHAGIPDVVREGDTGFLVDEGDVEGMAAAMTRLLSDSELSRRMGESARKRVRDLFSMSRHIVALQKTIDEARAL